jgi:hypothetical protein
MRSAAVSTSKRVTSSGRSPGDRVLTVANGTTVPPSGHAPPASAAAGRLGLRRATVVANAPKEGSVKRVMLFALIAVVGGMVVYLARRRLTESKELAFRDELESLPSLSS